MKLHCLHLRQWYVSALETVQHLARSSWLLLMQTKNYNWFIPQKRLLSLRHPSQWSLNSQSQEPQAGVAHSWRMLLNMTSGFSTLPGEMVQALKCSCRNVLGLAQLMYKTVNQIVWGQKQGSVIWREEEGKRASKQRAPLSLVEKDCLGLLCWWLK